MAVTHGTGKRKKRGPLSRAEVAHIRAEILRDFGWGVVFFFTLLAIKHVTIDRAVIHLQQAAYYISQDWLARSRGEQTSVVVVDISSLGDPCSAARDRSEQAPRLQLKKAISAVVSEKPAAVAVDIDFSPGLLASCDSRNGVQWTDRGGPPLFDFVLQQDVPVFLGVYRTETAAPAQWLGAQGYEKLAVSLLLPPERAPSYEKQEHPADIGVRRSMPRQLRVGTAQPLDSMAFALAKTLPQTSWRHRLTRVLPHWAFETVHPDTPVKDVSVDTFLVDFSALDYLQENLWRYKDGKLEPPDNKSAELGSKLVLLGYADANAIHGQDDPQTGSRQLDRFTVPGSLREVPGVFWHACATDTLLRGELIEPTSNGKFLLDTLFYVGLVLLPIAGMRWHYRRRRVNKPSPHRLESRAAKLSALIVLLAGTVLVGVTRLMWDDFLIVAVVSMMHPTLHEYTAEGADWTRRLLRHHHFGT
jgi:hypothetical protein